MQRPLVNQHLPNPSPNPNPYPNPNPNPNPNPSPSPNPNPNAMWQASFGQRKIISVHSMQP